MTSAASAPLSLPHGPAALFLLLLSLVLSIVSASELFLAKEPGFGVVHIDSPFQSLTLHDNVSPPSTSTTARSSSPPCPYEFVALVTPPPPSLGGVSFAPGSVVVPPSIKWYARPRPPVSSSSSSDGSPPMKLRVLRIDRRSLLIDLLRERLVRISLLLPSGSRQAADETTSAAASASAAASSSPSSPPPPLSLAYKVLPVSPLRRLSPSLYNAIVSPLSSLVFSPIRTLSSVVHDGSSGLPLPSSSCAGGGRLSSRPPTSLDGVASSNDGAMHIGRRRQSRLRKGLFVSADGKKACTVGYDWWKGRNYLLQVAPDLSAEEEEIKRLEELKADKSLPGQRRYKEVIRKRNLLIEDLKRKELLEKQKQQTQGFAKTKNRRFFSFFRKAGQTKAAESAKPTVAAARSGGVRLNPAVAAYLRSELKYDDRKIEALEKRLATGGARDADIIRVGALGAMNEDDSTSDF